MKKTCFFIFLLLYPVLSMAEPYIEGSLTKIIDHKTFFATIDGYEQKIIAVNLDLPSRFIGDNNDEKYLPYNKQILNEIGKEGYQFSKGFFDKFKKLYIKPVPTKTIEQKTEHVIVGEIFVKNQNNDFISYNKSVIVNGYSALKPQQEISDDVKWFTWFNDYFFAKKHKRGLWGKFPETMYSLYPEEPEKFQIEDPAIYKDMNLSFFK